MAHSEAAILEQIKSTQRDMVAELAAAVKKPSFNVANPSLLMFGREDKVEGYWRFLQQTEWDLEDSLKLIQSAYEWHVRSGDVVRGILKDLYTRSPGFLSLRQIGFDKTGRPALYGCFAQNGSKPAEITVDSAIAHFVHLAEMAGRTNVQRDSEDGGSSNVIIIDCSGFDFRYFQKADTILKVYQTLCLLYPNVIHSISVVNYTQEVRNTWSTLKSSLGESLASKVKFLPPTTTAKALSENFGLEAVQWLQAEMRLNKETPLPPSQVTFYEACADHDPRGTALYVSTYLNKDGFPDGHRPHGGIMFGK